MKALGQRYVQYFSRTYRRSGTLREGRFRSCLLQDDAYLLACHRYIELNPVRAGMVEHPADYPWSSALANLLGEENRLITQPPLYLARGGAIPLPAYRLTVSCFVMSSNPEYSAADVMRQMVISHWAMRALRRELRLFLGDGCGPVCLADQGSRQRWRA